jgi:hypothetical protein
VSGRPWPDAPVPPGTVAVGSLDMCAPSFVAAPSVRWPWLDAQALIRVAARPLDRACSAERRRSADGNDSARVRSPGATCARRNHKRERHIVNPNGRPHSHMLTFFSTGSVPIPPATSARPCEPQPGQRRHSQAIRRSDVHPRQRSGEHGRPNAGIAEPSLPRRLFASPGFSPKYATRRGRSVCAQPSAVIAARYRFGLP